MASLFSTSALLCWISSVEYCSSAAAARIKSTTVIGTAGIYATGIYTSGFYTTGLFTTESYWIEEKLTAETGESLSSFRTSQGEEIDGWQRERSKATADGAIAGLEPLLLRSIP